MRRSPMKYPKDESPDFPLPFFIPSSIFLLAPDSIFRVYIYMIFVDFLFVCVLWNGRYSLG